MLGRSAHFSGDRLKRHCSRLSRSGQVDALARLLRAVPHREARLAVYWALLNAYGGCWPGDVRCSRTLTAVLTGVLCLWSYIDSCAD